MRTLTPMIAAITIAAAPPQPSEQFSNAVGAALQADEGRALRALEGIELSALSEKDRAVATCMLERFGPGSKAAPAASNSLADRSLAFYRDYWHGGMAQPARREAEEQRLTERLRRLLEAPEGSDLDALEPILATALEKEGFHSLQGQTGLLRELMVWSKQEERVMHAKPSRRRARCEGHAARRFQEPWLGRLCHLRAGLDWRCGQRKKRFLRSFPDILVSNTKSSG